MTYKIEPEYEIKVLQYLADKQGEWTCLWERYFEGNPEHPSLTDVSYAFPKDYPRILQLTIMRRLYRKDLIGGCVCGCRGDFEITDKGLDVIGVKRYTPYTGY